MKIIAATGHRPPKCGGYSPDAEYQRRRLARNYLEQYRPDLVLTGMAQGWDQDVAVAAWDLGIPYEAAIPFDGQESVWGTQAQEAYNLILHRASDLVVVSPGGYTSWALQCRNEWLVDHATEMLVLWDGNQTGGTFNCLKYAIQTGVPWLNVWSAWKIAYEPLIGK